MQDRKRLESLREGSEFLRTLSEDQVAQLEEQGRWVSFEAGEAILEFGQTGRFLGILAGGEAEASVIDDNGDRHVLAKLGAGDVFGVMSLMTGEKAVCDIVGATRCRALLVPQHLFSALIAGQPQAIAYLSRQLVARLNWPNFREMTQSLSHSTAKKSHDPYNFGLETETPMRLLVINAGSSSLKYDLFHTHDPEQNASGNVEGIGGDSPSHSYTHAGKDGERGVAASDHTGALAVVLDSLIAPQTGVLEKLDDVSAVGHRVVHGAAKYSHAILIDDTVIADIEAASGMAPLHNPANLAGIRGAMDRIPGVPHVAVFDTAFHQSMPAYAYLYGLPFSCYEDHGIRRYGFHGISHRYVSLKVAEYLEEPYNALETIVCHLGNGASVCAVDHGRSVDTSMGFTPAEGLMMGTRCGDLDPAVVAYLMRAKDYSVEDIERIVNHDGGLKGISGISNDMREVERAADAGDHRALLALKTFCYRVRKYIGSYAAAMGGLDVVVFTGGIGEHSVSVRSLSCQGLDKMGVRIDERKNQRATGGEIVDISAEDADIKVLVVPTDEERMIARDTLRALDNSYVAEILKRQRKRAIPIEVSAHHVHLSREHVEALFGPGHELKPIQDLSQPGQFACEERVALVGPRGRVDRVRVLGPERKETQVEISMTEQFKLGVQPPIRESGDLADTPGMTLEGDHGAVELEQGVVCALRHIHMTPGDALELGLNDKDLVRVRVEGDRELVFGDVLVRVSPKYQLAMHIDTDEGNAASIQTGMMGYVDDIQSRE